MTPRRVYLDYHATTPVDPRAIDAMLPFFGERFGNPASRNHAFGWEASEAVEQARAQVASLINAPHRDIVFTSGATESSNLALKGLARAGGPRRHLVTVATEHKSVLDTCRVLEREGCTATVLTPRPDGLVDLDRLREAVTDRTLVVSVMLANNEIGTIQPLAEVSAIAHERGAIVHTDAAQAVGKIPVDVAALDVDLLSFTGHKMYAPKGVGALYIRHKTVLDLEPLVHGGGHERGLRSGTLNVPAVVGFGKAAEVAAADLEADATRLSALRDRLLLGLRSRIDGLHVNGTLAPRLPHNLSVSIEGVEPEALVLSMDDLAVSSGSACSSGKTSPSYVLKAIGRDDELALATLRFGLGRWTTSDDIEFAIDKVATVVGRLRALKAELGI